MTRALSAHMTPARRVWLQQLANEGPARRAKSVVGLQCMELGWTEWDYRAGGQPITAVEARERFGDGWWYKVNHYNLERITPAGRAALARATEGAEPD